MTRIELLARLKHDMTVYLNSRIRDAISEGDIDEQMELEKDRALVQRTLTLGPVFDAMKGWDAPGAIIFVFKCAIDDPNNMLPEDDEIPMRWDT